MGCFCAYYDYSFIWSYVATAVQQLYFTSSQHDIQNNPKVTKASSSLYGLLVTCASWQQATVHMSLIKKEVPGKEHTSQGLGLCRETILAEGEVLLHTNVNVKVLC